MLAAEKTTKAKAATEDQIRRTSDAIYAASTDAQNYIGEIADEVKLDANDAQKKVGENSLCSISCRIIENFHFRREGRQHREIDS